MSKAGVFFKHLFYVESRLRVATAHGVVLTSLVNKALGSGSLLGESSPVFAVLPDGGSKSWVYSKAFQVIARERESVSAGQRVRVRFVSPQLQVSGELSIHLSGAPEILLKLQLRNDSTSTRRLCIAFPLLWAVRISRDPRQDYYFFPFIGGWCVNLPYDLAVPYGMSPGSLQVLSVFCPTSGGGAYIYVKDNTGAVKIMMLRKREAKGQSAPAYIPLCDLRLQKEPAYTPLPFPDDEGTSLGVRTLWLTLRPGERLTLPEGVVGVHVGDFRQPLERYCAWVRTWWQAPRTPVWTRGFASYCYAHDEDSVRLGKYVARPNINPPHQVMQWAYWWRHSDLNRLGQDPKPDRWYRETHGDYEYEERWGGRAALREEVRRYQQAGSRMALYLQSYLVWKHSTVAHKHHPGCALINPDGSYNEDYTDEQANMNFWGLCPRTSGWQEFLVQTCDRLMQDIAPDGIYLDSMSNAPFCYHPGHCHEFQPASGVRDLLTRVRSVIKSHNPQAILWVEHPCSDYLMQFIDCTWLETFASNVPQYTEFDRGYGLHFLRFYFPEIAYAEWNPDVWKPELQERNLFNGIGSSSATPNDRLFHENQTAFASLHPEPLVPTNVSGVLANCFPTSGKRVYTIWNRNEAPVAGTLITVPHRKGYHYVELRSGREVPFRVRSVATSKRGQQADLMLELPPAKVACIAQLPAVLKASRQKERVLVRLSRPLKKSERVMVTRSLEEAGVEAKPIGSLLVAVVDVSPTTPLFVRLFDGEELVDHVVLDAENE
jgi:hypothetical protein